MPYTSIVDNKRIVTKTDIDLNCQLSAILEEYKFSLTDYNEYTLYGIRICWCERFNRITEILIYIGGKFAFKYSEESEGNLIYENDKQIVFLNHQHLINHLMDNIRTYWKVMGKK